MNDAEKTMDLVDARERAAALLVEIMQRWKNNGTAAGARIAVDAAQAIAALSESDKKT